MNTILTSKNMHRCRLCLKMSTNVIDVFREDFPKMIKLLTNLKVDPKDNLPRVSCITCAKQVKSAMLMRKQIIISYKTLIEEERVKKTHGAVKKPKPLSSVTNSKSILPSSLSHNSPHDSQESSVSPEVVVVQTQIRPHVQVKNSGVEKQIIAMTTPKYEVNNTEIEKIDIKIEPLENPLTNSKERCYTSPISLNKSEVSLIPIVKKEKSVMNRFTQRRQLLQTARVTDPGKITNSYRQKIMLQQYSIKNEQTQFRKKVASQSLLPNCQAQFKMKKKTSEKTNPYRPNAPMTCKTCQKTVQRQNMKKHLETHEINHVCCHLCGKLCRSTTLRAHIFYFHKSTADQYVCDQCGKNFRYRAKFLLHQKKEHGGTKDFECNICGKKFFERKYLTSHINGTHKKIRTHICDYCGKEYSGKYALTVHIRQHTNKAPYACQNCGKRFRQKVSLKSHLKLIHNIVEENTVFCEICAKGFASAIALKSHSRLHEGKKCEHCSEVFVQDEYLKKHMEENHDIKPVDEHVVNE